MEKCKINSTFAVLETLEPMAIKRGMSDEVGDPYPCAKCYYDPIKRFRYPACCVQSDSAIVNYCATARNATQGIGKAYVCPSVCLSVRLSKACIVTK